MGRRLRVGPYVDLAAIGWVVVFAWGLLHQVPDLANPSRYPPWTASTRIWLSLDDLPPYVWRAFVAAEDPTLFEERWSSLAFPLARSARRRQGADGLKELLLVWRLNTELTRHELVEIYVNVVFLGEDLRGVEAGARHWFGKPAAQLELGEAAMLAGMAPAPSRYSPDHEELARWRRGLVLGRMVEQGWIPSADAAVYDTP